MDYNARVELDACFPTDRDEADALVDRLMDEVEVYGGTVAQTHRGRVELIITVPAHSMRQAIATALAVSTAAGYPEPFALEVLPTVEYHRRVDDAPVPPLLSVTQAAELLGVTRARVQQLIDGGQLAAVKVGEQWAVVRAAAAARARALQGQGQGAGEVPELVG